MANRNTDYLTTFGRLKRQISVAITAAGTSNPSAVASSGNAVASVTRTATGTYLLTMADKYGTLLSAVGSVRNTTAADIYVQPAVYTQASGQLSFRTMTGGSAADVASGSTIYLDLVFDDALES